MKKFLVCVCVVLWTVFVLPVMLIGLYIAVGSEVDTVDVVMLQVTSGLVTLSVMLYLKLRNSRATINRIEAVRQGQCEIIRRRNAAIREHKEWFDKHEEIIAKMEKKHDFERRVTDGEIANYLGLIEQLRKLFYGTKKVKKININRERTRRDTKEKLKT